MMYWYGNDINGWGYPLMIIGMVGFAGVVATGVVLLVRHSGRSERTGGAAPAHHTPQQVLAERFTRGDIEEDEYTGRLAALHQHAPVRS